MISKEMEALRDQRFKKRKAKYDASVDDRLAQFEYDAEYGLDARDKDIDPKSLVTFKPGGYCVLVPDPDGDIEHVSEGVFRDTKAVRLIKLTSQQPCRGKRNDPENPGQEIACAASLSRSQVKCKVCGYHRLDDKDDIDDSLIEKRGFMSGMYTSAASDLFS